MISLVSRVQPSRIPHRKYTIPLHHAFRFESPPTIIWTAGRSVSLRRRINPHGMPVIGGGEHDGIFDFVRVVIRRFEFIALGIELPEFFILRLQLTAQRLKLH